MSKPYISVLVPVFRSEGTLWELHSRLTSVLREAAGQFEIIFIEDSGGDRSWNIIRQLSEQDNRTRGIRLSRNYGQHNALLCGIRAASGEIIVTLDDDLQNPPEEIPKLLTRLDGFDVVYGSPEQEQHGFLRDQASRLTKLALAQVMGAETARRVSAFRCFRARLRDGFSNYRGSFASIDVLLTWATSRFAYIPVRHEPRLIGNSNYSIRKLITHAINMMTGFTILPLQLASMAGFAFSLFGLGVLIYVIARYFVQGAAVPGFAFLGSIIAIFAGVQLFALGIIGEYLARMHVRMLDRPSYVVAEDISAPVVAHDRDHVVTKIVPSRRDDV